MNISMDFDYFLKFYNCIAEWQSYPFASVAIASEISI